MRYFTQSLTRHQARNAAGTPICIGTKYSPFCVTAISRAMGGPSTAIIASIIKRL